jgi:hypothetical protein
MKRAIYQDREGYRVELIRELSGHVEFVREGGGFVRCRPAAEFHREFKPAPEPKFKLGSVTGDWLDGKKIAAFLDGTKWNGWAKPYFPLISALKVVHHWPGARYDVSKDAIIIEASEDMEREEYAAVTIEVDGAKVKAFPIGAGSWCWEEA